MDSLWLFYLNGGLLNNNTVACYDRMIPAVSSLHLQSLGLPGSAVKCSVQINKKMKYFVKTNAGESKKFYQHTEEYMKGEEGQCKISFPPNWLFQSSTLLTSLREQCTGLYLISVDKKFISKQEAKKYVDDTDTVTADQRTQASDTSAIITDQMKVITQTWSDLIHGSGGEISKEKSCWWLVWWNWKAGKAMLATIEEVGAQITLTNSPPLARRTLKWKNPDKAIRQFGLKSHLLGKNKRL
eukprot:15248855-Ditylum_brightwellii.AAC.2